ncbi:hypothetical protein TRIP_B50316 [uncultured Desulfatiglans sp.]|nr:hypothetical protein TRIP_B50316 [uncultured Desulfatiglans sp.]
MNDLGGLMVRAGGRVEVLCTAGRAIFTLGCNLESFVDARGMSRGVGI